MIMLGFLFTWIHCWFEHAEQRHNDEYLAAARDIAELERRMRSMERSWFDRNFPLLICLGTVA
jgi:hypothetical protein